MAYDHAQYGIKEVINLDNSQDLRLAVTTASLMTGRMLFYRGPIRVTKWGYRVGTGWSKASQLTVGMVRDGTTISTIRTATPVVTGARASVVDADGFRFSGASKIGFDCGGLPNDAAVALWLEYRREYDDKWENQDKN